MCRSSYVSSMATFVSLSVPDSWRGLFAYHLYIQSRDNSAVVATIRSSKRLRTSLEVGAVAGMLLAPWAIIWVPYVLNQFDKIIMCSNSSSE